MDSGLVCFAKVLFVIALIVIFLGILWGIYFFVGNFNCCRTRCGDNCNGECGGVCGRGRYGLVPRYKYWLFSQNAYLFGLVALVLCALAYGADSMKKTVASAVEESSDADNGSNY